MLAPFLVLSHCPGKKILTLCGLRYTGLSCSLPGPQEENLKGTPREAKFSSPKGNVLSAWQDSKGQVLWKRKKTHVLIWTSICVLKTGYLWKYKAEGDHSYWWHILSPAFKAKVSGLITFIWQAFWVPSASCDKTTQPLYFQRSRREFSCSPQMSFAPGKWPCSKPLVFFKSPSSP